MPNYRVTFGWNQSVMGVSETYYSPNVSADGFVSLLNTWLKLRFAMMFTNQFPVGVRISQWGTKRRSVLLVPPGDYLPGTSSFITIPPAGQIAFTGLTSQPDQLRAVLQTRLTFDTDRNTIRYQSGIPDALSATEPSTLDFTLAPAWGKAWSAFRDNLVNAGWQLAALDRSPANGPFQVIGLVQQAAAPLLLGVVLVAATAPTLAKGQKIRVSGFRPKKGTRASTLNGTWYIDSVNTTLVPDSVVVFLRGSAGIDPDAQRFTDVTALWLTKQTLYPIQAVHWIRAGIHKRGRPFAAPRGRRLSRPSLDP